MALVNNHQADQDILLKLDARSGNQVLEISSNAEEILNQPIENLKKLSAFWPAFLHQQDYQNVQTLISELCDNSRADFKTKVKSKLSQRKSQWFELECQKSDQYILGKVTRIEQQEQQTQLPESFFKYPDYKELFNNLQDVYYRTDLQGNIYLVSPSVEKHFGITQQEAYSANILDYYRNSKDREIVLGLLLKEGVVQDYEIQMKHASGRTFWMSCNAKLISNSKGQPIGIEGVGRDINDKKENEELLRRQTFYLKESQHIAKLGNWKFNLKTNEFELADIIYSILGLSQNETITPSVIFRLMRSKKAIKEIRQYLKNLSFTNSSLQLEIEVKTRNNRTKHLLVNIFAIFTIEEKPYTFRGTIQDFTVLKQTEHKLRETNLQLKKNNEYLDQFVHTLAHDMRAPIANLSSLIRLLKCDIQENDILNNVEGSVQKLDTTLKGLVKLIDLQKLDQQDVRKIKFVDILETIQISLQNDINITHATITKNFEVETINYVEPYIVSIIYNLMNNAIKYRDQSRDLNIHLATKKIEDYILLTVSDNGLGINFTNQLSFFSNAFKRHFRHTNSGLGIGLHLIKTMVQRNDGKISVDSQVGEGSTFKVYLKPYLKSIE